MIRLFFLVVFCVSPSLLSAQSFDMLREGGFSIGSRSLSVITMLLQKGAKIETETLNNPEVSYVVKNFHPFGIKCEKAIFVFHDDTLRRAAVFPINDYGQGLIPYIRLHARLSGANPPARDVSGLKSSSSALYASTVGSEYFGQPRFEFSLSNQGKRRILIFAKGDPDPDDEKKEAKKD